MRTAAPYRLPGSRIGPSPFTTPARDRQPQYARSLDPDGCLARSVASQALKKRARSATAIRRGTRLLTAGHEPANGRHHTQLPTQPPVRDVVLMADSHCAPGERSSPLHAGFVLNRSSWSSPGRGRLVCLTQSPYPGISRCVAGQQHQHVTRKIHPGNLVG